FKKVPQEVCNKRTIESIIKAGGFDSLGYTRRSLLAVHEEAVDASVIQKRQEANNQFDFFSLLDQDDDSGLDTGFGITVPDLPEGVELAMLSTGRDMMGVYVADHPVQGLTHASEQHGDDSVTQVPDDEGPSYGAFVTI